MKDTILSIENLSVEYRARSGTVKRAVSNVSLMIEKGDTVGLVGESGCGKSSLARAVMQFVRPVSGRVLLDTEDLSTIKKRRMRQIRFKFQMIFQDSISSLNPRRKIGTSIAMPLKLLGVTPRAERINTTCKMMQKVSLDPNIFDLFPYQISGGQCQRVQIARALITEPELLICDEPVSSLDVSVQAQIINLLNRLVRDSDMAMLFISHDLSVVKTICNRIAVMYAGKLCEVSDNHTLYKSPLHPYTKILINSIPRIGIFKKEYLNNQKAIAVPSSINSGHGCNFRTLCCNAKNKCKFKEPLLTKVKPGIFVACHFPL